MGLELQHPVCCPIARKKIRSLTSLFVQASSQHPPEVTCSTSDPCGQLPRRVRLWVARIEEPDGADHATNLLQGRPIVKEHERVHKLACSQLMGMTAYRMGCTTPDIVRMAVLRGG